MGLPGVGVNQLANTLVAEDTMMMARIRYRPIDLSANLWCKSATSAVLTFCPQAIGNFPLLAVFTDGTRLATICEPIKQGHYFCKCSTAM